MEWGLLAVVSALATAASVALGLTGRADNLIYDALMRLEARPPNPDIVIVAIDNRSLQALGRWPLPRKIQAEALEQLARRHPKATAYDVLLTEPGEGDPALAAALRALGPAFLPVQIEVPGENGAPYQVVEPVEPLRAAVAGLGQANLDFDSDGVVRKVFLDYGDGAGRWPHLMQLMRLAALDRPVPPPPAGESGAPLRRGEPRLISYAGPPGRFPTVSLIDVVRGETPEAALRGKLVLVGASADGLGDRFPTPVSTTTEIMAGVELQANVLDALLGGRLIRPLGAPASIALSLVPLAALLAGFLRLKPLSNLMLGLGLMAATLGLSLGLFAFGKAWWPPVTALAALVLVFPLWSWRRLAAASAFMVEELSLFEAEADILPRRAAGRPAEAAPETSDVIARQARLVRDAIRRAQDLQRFMADTIAGLPDATLVADSAGVVRVANKAAERLFGRLGGVSPVERPLGELIGLLEAAAGEGPDASAAYDGEYRAADGTWLHVRDIVFRDAAEEAGGRIVRFIDITEMKLAARQREQVLQLLSHDMRSPQVSILALIERTRGLEDGVEAAAGESLRRIGDYARRTLSLADDFVQLARAENPNYALELLNASDVLLDAVDELWPQAQARAIALTAEGCEAEHLVLADRSLLTRVFVNLIGNAIKYSDASTAVACAIRAEGGGGFVRIAVRDQGRGMSPEQLARLFQPFQRAPQGAQQAGQRAVDGIGLGLAFVRTVVERHGGAVACDSRLGEGSTFTVTLPLAEAEAG